MPLLRIVKTLDFFSSCPPLHDTFTFIICIYADMQLRKVGSSTIILYITHVSYPFWSTLPYYLDLNATMLPMILFLKVVPVLPTPNISRDS